LGIDNIVVHAADIPTTHKEKDRKRDPLDSRKLARELENGSLNSVYVPDELHQQLRSLCRLRFRIRENTTRVMNRIKSYLYFNGISIPSHREVSHWSSNFIKWLESLDFAHSTGKDYLKLCLDELQSHRKRLLEVTRMLRNYCSENEITKIIVPLYSVPGVGFVTAVTYYSELMDINRFPTLDHLASYVGLGPSTSSSGEKIVEHGLTKRRNSYLKYLIIEAAWIAIGKDPVLLHKFNKLTMRMKRQGAIIRIAKKLLNRIRYIWKNQVPYVKGVIE
jgi:transposase